MKAAVLRGVADMVITDLPDPSPGPGEVVVRVSHCGICGSDLHFWDEGPIGDEMIMGHEFSGTIAAVGPGVTAWREGDRVDAYGGVPCGTCPYCRVGDEHICVHNTGIGVGGRPGGYAEYVVLGEGGLLPVPKNITLEQAATVEPLANGLHCVRKSVFRPGDGAFVVGAGPIGLSIILWLRKLGADKIVVSEPAAGRRRVADACGADLVVDPREVDLRALLEAEFEGVGPQLVYECVGRPETVQDALFQARKGGQAVIMGVCFEQVTVSPLALILRETQVRGVIGTTRPEMEETLAALADGSLRPEGFVSGHVALQDVPGTFEQLHHPNTEVKVLIDHAL